MSIEEALQSIKLHNNSKRRRFRKSLVSKGPSGEPHPFGNRSQRRSEQGKAETALMLEKIRAFGRNQQGE